MCFEPLRVGLQTIGDLGEAVNNFEALLAKPIKLGSSQTSARRGLIWPRDPSPQLRPVPAMRPTQAPCG
jgi:hypothetical protein